MTTDVIAETTVRYNINMRGMSDKSNINCDILQSQNHLQLLLPGTR